MKRKKVKRKMSCWFFSWLITWHQTVVDELTTVCPPWYIKHANFFSSMSYQRLHDEPLESKSNDSDCRCVWLLFPRKESSYQSQRDGSKKFYRKERLHNMQAVFCLQDFYTVNFSSQQVDWQLRCNERWLRIYKTLTTRLWYHNTRDDIRDPPHCSEGTTATVHGAVFMVQHSSQVP